MGTGFFVSKDGQVLTTGLLKDPDRIWVEHMGSFYLAEKLGQDVLCNLSLLKLEERPSDFSFVTLSDFPDDPKAGSILVGLTCALSSRWDPLMAFYKARNFLWGKGFSLLKCSERVWLWDQVKLERQFLTFRVNLWESVILVCLI